MGLGILQSQALIIPRPLEFGRISAKNQKTPYLTMLLNSGLSHLPSGLQGFRASGLQGFSAFYAYRILAHHD
jgi:hypothetical protein